MTASKPTHSSCCWIARIESVCVCACLTAIACLVVNAQFAAGQDASASPQNTAAPEESRSQVAAGEELANKAAVEDETTLRLQREIELLNHPSYEARKVAQWRLAQMPAESLPLMRAALVDADHNTGAGIIDLLTQFALDSSISVSLESLEVLQETAKNLTSIGRMAENSLEAISELQELQAIEVLMHHSAKIGPRTFSLNGTLSPQTEDALHITSEFTGDDETIRWIRLLKSVETVCLEGPHIDRRYLEAIVHIDGLRNIKLKDVDLNAEDLKILQQLPDLDHLGLLYVPIDDSIVDLLVELPVRTSMKLYGTEITPKGFSELSAQLDDLQFYYGKGGFLGVSSLLNTLRVRVTPNSAAQEAGMRTGDEIFAVNATPLRSFLELRDALSEFGAGDQVRIAVLRGNQRLVFDVTLKQEP